IYAVLSGEVAKLTREHQIGITADSGNINEIVTGFERFLQFDEKELKEIGDRAWNLYRSVFDREVSIQKLEKLVFDSSN
ncbi:MAG: hypothetical protein HKN67_07290, partial [Saprospiraceae bacterium]|nr:hypothetical protein [Saprospiraceae bacterium]